MKKMRKKYRALLVAVLSFTMLAGATMTTNAAGTNVMFTVEATDITTAVTVPGTIPITFNADGTNTYPTNWAITNNSENASIKLTTITASLVRSAWRLLYNTDSMKDVTCDTNKIKFYMGVTGNMQFMAPDSTGVGHINYGNSGIKIEAGESKVFSFEVKRGAFSESREEALGMELTLNFEYA